MIQSKSRFLEAAKGAKPYKVNGVLMQGQEFRTFTNMFGYKEISCLLNWKDGKLDTDWDADPVIPAVQMSDGHTEYWKDGKLHNDHKDDDGNLMPAVITDNWETTEYWVDGTRVFPPKDEEQK